MKIKDILTEHFINLNTPEEKSQYKDEVWDILQKSYASIGGFKSAVDAEELVDTPGLWKLSRRNGKIVAVGIYRDMHGRKSIAVGTDGSAEGKRDFYKIKNEDVRFGRAWCEASGAVEAILKKNGSRPIPAKFASVLTGKQIVEINPDGVHYTRLIQGHPHEKIIFGVAKLDDALLQKLADAGIELHDLPPNIN